MGSCHQEYQWLNPVRMHFPIILVTMLFVTMHPTISTAQGKAGALRLLGKFAAGVLSTTASSILAKKAEAFLDPEVKPPKDDRPFVAPKPEPQFSGYTFTLMWTVPSGRYEGKITMRGLRGLFHVQHGHFVIEQDMMARPCGMAPGCAAHGRDILLVGSNPRQLSPGMPILYQPDVFRLTPSPNGDWTIADTCDVQQCAPVYVTEATVF